MIKNSLLIALLIMATSHHLQAMDGELLSGAGSAKKEAVESDADSLAVALDNVSLIDKVIIIIEGAWQENPIYRKLIAELEAAAMGASIRVESFNGCKKNALCMQVIGQAKALARQVEKLVREGSQVHIFAGSSSFHEDETLALASMRLNYTLNSSRGSHAEGLLAQLLDDSDVATARGGIVELGEEVMGGTKSIVAHYVGKAPKESNAAAIQSSLEENGDKATIERGAVVENFLHVLPKDCCGCCSYIACIACLPSVIKCGFKCCYENKATLTFIGKVIGTVAIALV